MMIAMHRAGNVLFALLLPVTAAQAEQQSPATPTGFVDAATVVNGLVVDVRYFGANNFVGARIDGYEAARCLLSRQAAAALAAVQRDLAERNLGLKVFDCYRPERAVAHFVRWARDAADVARKKDFYPDVDKRDLFRLGYIAHRSGHSRGSTVDLTLVHLPDRREADMGSPYDFFGPISSVSARGINERARQNRIDLARAMARRGFRPYDKEWWHFTLAPEPFPDTYFNFPVK
jgi:D-alanyl-D-alanine dipeptidase